MSIKIPTYEEYLKEGGMASAPRELTETAYKELLSKFIRVALDNMMLNVHQNQKEASVEQLHSLAVMFHTLSSSFFFKTGENV